LFLYTNNEQSGKEIKKTIPFTIALKKIKYLGINLTKEVKDLYTEDYKILLKEIKEDTNGKTSHVWGLQNLTLLRCPYLSTANYRLNISPIKIPIAFFAEI